jgi:primosomal protein N' (replication factor Y)
MNPYADVAVNVAQVKGSYHYHIPDSLQGQLSPGQLVIVPFGSQTVQGIILKTLSQPEVPKTKDIRKILDPIPVVTGHQIELARQLSRTTLSPLGITLHAMLPGGLSKKADIEYRLSERSQQRLEAGDPVYGELSSAQETLTKLLIERGPLRGRQLQRSLPYRHWRKTVGALERRGVITSRPILQSPSVHPKKVSFLKLTASADQVKSQLDSLARSGYPDALQRRQQMVRRLLAAGRPLRVTRLYQETGGNLSDIEQLEKRELVRIEEREVIRDPLADLSAGEPRPVRLTADQQQVFDTVAAAFKDGISKPHLLYGVTGSGKTEIYLRAVQKTLAAGRQALILVPEIALTPQTVRRFYRRFPDQVGVLHSQLSEGERYDTWRLAREGKISIIVGPRSALFTPFPDIGLIVVDECHDDSYYQAEIAPRYHAVRAAAAYAEITGAVCLMGSATPNVTSTYQAARGMWIPLSLPERILAHQETIRAQIAAIQEDPEQSRYQTLEEGVQMAELPGVDIVDMREELKAGNRSIFSIQLQQSLADVLGRNQQAILFLNRRGSASYVFCRECGEGLRCPRCDTSLTYHRSEAALRCHHCGYSRKMPHRCPSCGSDKIRQLGTGTEQVENALQALFPAVRTLRWDRDTTRKKGAHWEIMDRFSAQEADILIGTQMLAKGLDLPLVTLVGVVLADMGLHLPDYRTNERTFQILTQVAGRAGRSPLGGEVILQTFQPDHYVIQTASRHDYRDFYAREIAYRRELRYPPFQNLARLVIQKTDRDQVKSAAGDLARSLKRFLKQEGYRATEMVGPVPCYFSRLRGQYRWQIILRGPNPAAILREHPPPRDWIIEINPPSLL